MSTDAGPDGGGFDGAAVESATEGDFNVEGAPTGAAREELSGNAIETEALKISEPSEPVWADQLDADTRTRLEGKGVDLSDPQKAVEALAKMQRDAETSFQQVQRQVKEYEEAFNNLAMEEAVPQQQAPPPQQGEQTLDDFDAVLNQFAQAVDAGAITAEQGLPVVLQRLRDTMSQDFDRRLDERAKQLRETDIAPLKNTLDTQHWREEVQKIRTADPDGFSKYGGRAREILEGMIQKDPAMRENRDAMQIAFAMARNEDHLRGLQERRAQTLQGGASGAGPTGQQVNPADAIWQQMEESVPPGGSGGF